MTFVLLLDLDEVVISTKLPEHVSGGHGSSIAFIDKVNPLLLLGPISKTNGKERIRFYR